MKLPTLYTLEEAAAQMHASIKVDSLRRAIRAGRLAATKIGKSYFVTDSAIAEFVTCPERKSPPASGREKTARGSSLTTAVSTGQVLAQNAAARLLQTPQER